MKSVWSVITGFMASLLSRAVTLYLLMRGGRRDERLDSAEQTIKDMQKANSAAATDVYDDKLRDKYGLK